MTIRRSCVRQRALAPFRRLRLCAAASVFLLGACASLPTTGERGAGAVRQAQPDPGELRAADYYPLAIGHRWRFRVRPAPAGEEEQEIALVAQDAQGFFATNLGNRLMSRASGIFDGDRFLIEEPLRVGHTWMSVPSASTIERYRVLSTSAQVSVPAGTFTRCVQVEMAQAIRTREGNAGRLVGIWSYAPGVGPVHFVQRVEFDDGYAQVNAEYALVEVHLAAGTPSMSSGASP